MSDLIKDGRLLLTRGKKEKQGGSRDSAVEIIING